MSRNNHFAGYGTGFEGRVAVRVVEEDGTEIGTGFAQTSGGMGAVGGFFGEITRSGRASGKLGFVEPWAGSGKGRGERPALVRAPVVLS